MAQTPSTPVHSVVDSDSPIYSFASDHSIIKSRSKSLTAKQKLQRVFAGLYDDDDEADTASSTWSSGQIQQHPVTDVTMEDIDDSEGCKKGEKDTAAGKEIASGSCMESSQEDVRKGEVKVRAEWLGTSQFYLQPLLDLQMTGELDGVIAYRDALAYGVSCFPYDPVALLSLSSTHGQLGFSDISVANAHRALLLIETALRYSTMTTNDSPAVSEYPQLDTLARQLISSRYRGYGQLSLGEDLRLLRLQAYQILLSGLLGTAANWEGLVVVKTALEQYPGDSELIELQANLKAGFLDRSQAYKELDTEIKMKKEDWIEATRIGKIYQKKYPWVEQSLYNRTPATLREANKGFSGSSCEVRPVVFGDAVPGRIAKEGEDVGPLGIFAVRDIEEGEIVMVDRTVTGVSDIPSSKFENCDACQGCLMPPYMRPDKIVFPTCCNKVAFCSLECYKLASGGYHKVLCGKDFSWLYEKIRSGKKSGAGGHWKSVNILRVIAVILADTRKSKNTKMHPLQHPLQHPLLARMSANYPPKDKIMGGPNDLSHAWLYFTNVVAPTQILLQLGVDVFTDDHWSPEVIQTIFWRIENNANMATTNLAGKEVHLTNLNPNYLFLNHSCQPNISWHGACSGNVSIEYLRTTDGGILQPGCSVVWCIAARDIKKDEELKISYVGNPKGDNDIGGGRDSKRAWLSKWFDNGCGCAICEEENRVETLKNSEKAGNDQPKTGCEVEGVEESA